MFWRWPPEAGTDSLLQNAAALADCLSGSGPPPDGRCRDWRAVKPRAGSFRRLRVAAGADPGGPPALKRRQSIRAAGAVTPAGGNGENIQRPPDTRTQSHVAVSRHTKRVGATPGRSGSGRAGYPLPAAAFWIKAGVLWERAEWRSRRARSGLKYRPMKWEICLEIK